MPSPFPGMDPYIESQRWRSFHSHLLTEIAASLVPHLRPRYEVLVEETVYLERHPELPPAVIRPDVTITGAGEPARRNGGGAAVLAAPTVVPLVMPESERHRRLELRLRETGAVVAIIELLSPGNKRPGSDGRREYLEKRDELIRSRTHLIEIDLLRGGERLPMAQPLPPAEYYVILSRAYERPNCQVWPLTLRHRLPQVPVPLAGEDRDVTLDLQTVFDAVYERAGFDYALDYTRPLLPPLDDEEARWVEATLTGAASDPA